MSYISISDTGVIEHHSTEPTNEDVTRLVAGTPQLLPTGGALVFWVNDDFVSLEQAGTVARNMIASLAVIGLDVPGLPIIAGNAVLTGIRMEDGLMVPGDLDDEDAHALMSLLGETRDFLAGRPTDLLPDVEASLRTVADLVRTQPLTRVIVQQVSLDEFLDFLGRTDPGIRIPTVHDGEPPTPF